MECSATHNKPATWLELAVARDGCREKCRVRVHAVAGRGDSCYAISLDDRWLYVGSGQLTVFHGLSSALHFLEVLRIENFEPGEITALASINRDRYCLCTDGIKGLLPCKRIQSHCRAAA